MPSSGGRAVEPAAARALPVDVQSVLRGTYGQTVPEEVVSLGRTEVRGMASVVRPWTP